MKKVITSIFLLLTIFLYSQTQYLEGKITDGLDASPLVAAIINVNNTEVYTDLEGYYKINLEPNINYTVTISYPDYQTKEISEVAIITNQNTLLNISLDKIQNNNSSLKEVVVKSTKKTESIASLITVQKNISFVAQVVSTEAIKRSPDKNTGEILKRVSGTSIQDGKYLVVRGLNDRYNQAMLNGVQLASTEPDRKTFSFDLFPANVIDNLIINKTFIPEMTGEWAGGLIQVNTKDIPTKKFFNLQIGNGYNFNAISNKFYSYKGGKLDFLGIDDGYRKLPSGFPTKNAFNILSDAEKTKFGVEYKKPFTLNTINFPQNLSLQSNGGFVTKLFNKEFGGVLGLTYSSSFKRTESKNRFFTINGELADINFDYNSEKYSNDILLGLLANFSIKLNKNNKISLKNILSSNSSKYVVLRTGKDFESDPLNGENIKARELTFKETTFLNTTLSGSHYLTKQDIKLNWYGSFGILDQYIPQQQRLQYNQSTTLPNAPYIALISSSLSQKSGSYFYSTLSDYLYNAGGDVAKSFTLFNNKQTIKAGYLFQIKDRLYNARPFSVVLKQDNPSLLTLNEDAIFNDENFGTEANQFQFNELTGNQYRYLANTTLNAGFLQLENNFSSWLKVLWGVRFENYDQLIGSKNTSDPRYVQNEVLDWLPALNITIKANKKTNIRIAASQTVVRPEFRELSPLAYYDFELGATILGNKKLKRTKITNLDLRYELYPRSGELITVAGFYKKFENPIELYFNQSGAGTSNTFNYLNVADANAYGVEVEGRKKLDFISFLKNFTLAGNIALIKSKVDDPSLKIDRPLQGQSSYTLNLSLQFDIKKYDLTSTLLFNKIGRRIQYVGNDQVPAIWEAPRALLDFQITKKILDKKGELKLNVSDILNKDAIFYHDLNNNGTYDVLKDALAIERNFGTTLSLSFSYRFK